MNPTRCACCHRYAPKGHGTDEPVGECRGHADLQEARNVARLWKARAVKAGWVKAAPKYPHERTLAEKTADHLADCIAQGKPLIYCQGPKRHHAIVGSPMGEQMVERGCFFCDAYPEPPA
jgi:hypothetical protein